MQICEQKSEKKNRIGIEFSIFFSHTDNRVNLRKSSPF